MKKIFNRIALCAGLALAGCGVQSGAPPTPTVETPDSRITRVDDVALLLIDVQKGFADPNGARGTDSTDMIAQRIASIIPEFRRAGIPIYVVAMKEEKVTHPSVADFYRFTPDSTRDVMLTKTTDSPFASGKTAARLKQDGRKLLLVAGFNASACLRDAVEDALRAGYDVCILSDLIGNDKLQTTSVADALSVMSDQGALIKSAQTVLNRAPRR